MSEDVKGFEKSLSWNDDPSDSQDLKLFDRWTQKLRTWGVESRGVYRSSWLDQLVYESIQGVRPVPIEERTDTQIFKIFFVFFTANFNILSYVYLALRWEILPTF